MGSLGRGLTVAALLLVTLASLSALVPARGTGCRVVAVTDGDTVRAWCPGEGFVSARLLGFDTPETWAPRCLSEWWAGTRATWALRWKLWTAGTVDTVLSGHDRYGRRLMMLALDGTDIAASMIGEGHARRYGGDRRDGWCGPSDPREDRPGGIRFIRPPAQG